MWIKYLIILSVMSLNFTLTQQNDRERESRALLKLLLKLPSYLGSGLGSGSSAILESIPLEKLSVVLNKINKIRICQLENVQNPSITALPGQDPTSPCRVFCKEELGGSTRGIKNVRYFVALVPDLTPCLIGDSILPLGTCTAGVCATTAVAGGAAAFTGTGVVAPVAGTGAVAGGTVAALSANDKSVASPKNNSTKI